jgi:hypothetical protein
MPDGIHRKPERDGFSTIMSIWGVYRKMGAPYQFWITPNSLIDLSVTTGRRRRVFTALSDVMEGC